MFFIFIQSMIRPHFLPACCNRAPCVARLVRLQRLFRLAVLCVVLAALPVLTAHSAAVQAATDERASSPTLYALVDEGSCLNVREHPHLGATVTLRLSRGDAVSLCSLRPDGWAQIDRAGDPGYCRVEYLTDAPPDAPVDAEVAVKNLRVRAIPGGKVLRKLQKGDTVSVYGWIPDTDGNRWANIGDSFVLWSCLSQPVKPTV